MAKPNKKYLATASFLLIFCYYNIYFNEKYASYFTTYFASKGTIEDEKHTADLVPGRRNAASIDDDDSVETGGGSTPVAEESHDIVNSNVSTSDTTKQITVEKLPKSLALQTDEILRGKTADLKRMKIRFYMYNDANITLRKSTSKRFTS
jgi:hypothetical protein